MTNKQKQYIMRISLRDNGAFVHNSLTQENVLINDKIFDEELFEYRIVDREDLIENLIMWISECGHNRQHDKHLMKEDLKYLMNVDDDCIFSSISTNEYIVSDDDNFDETCKELLELNANLK